MKQNYKKPEAEIVELVVEDVLNNSTDFDGFWSGEIVSEKNDK